MAKKGENIYKRKDGRWEARYIKGYDGDGRIRYGFCYGKSYKEAKEKRDAIRPGMFEGAPTAKKPSRRRLAFFCMEWLKLQEGRVKESTYVKYDNIVQRHILPKLGKTNRIKGKEYHYYYCPTGKKKGCAHPVMLKESVLAENIRNVLKGQIDNVVSLGAVLSGVDQIKINRQLADEYTSQVTENEKQIALALEFKARLYESMVQGMITREEFVSYKNKYTKQAEQLREANRDLQEKIRDVMENRSERNRWIRHFTKFATLDTLDRKAVVQLIQTITVYGKDELAIRFNYEDEYQKAKAMAEQVQLRKAG